jgi:hypothetical protein
MAFRRADRLASERTLVMRGPMSNLDEILQAYVSNGLVPGAVSLVARGDRVEAGSRRPGLDRR